MAIERSESINELATALSKAQGEIGGAEKDGRNPHFNSAFASLASVRDAFRDPLAKHGLSVVQLPEREGQEVVVHTVLLHTSGQYIGCRLSAVPVKADPQGIGSCISYLRRYSLMSVIGIAPEDDDGNAASEPARKPQQRRGNDVPTAARTEPPSSAAPPSGSVPETDDQKIARWTSALKACHSMTELKAVGKRISEDRQLSEVVRMQLTATYTTLQDALKPKKLPGPCSNCGDADHSVINCKHLSAEERAEALRTSAAGAA